jgi:hypothetical protein
MNPTTIQGEFRNRVCEQISLEAEGLGKFRVVTPFHFEDGDYFRILLKREADRWFLTDEAHTLMHLSYWLDDADLESGNRKELFERALSSCFVENRGGELMIPVSGDQFGDALFSFVQALSKVNDLSYLSRERVRSTFLDDVKSFLTSNISAERISLNWTDPEHDANRIYPVDYRINKARRPLFVYALPNDDRVRDATIYLHQFEQWDIPFRSMGIFEQQDAIQPKILARFTDVCEKTFSSLEANEVRILKYLERTFQEEGAELS